MTTAAARGSDAELPYELLELSARTGQLVRCLMVVRNAGCGGDSGLRYHADAVRDLRTAQSRLRPERVISLVVAV